MHSNNDLSTIDRLEIGPSGCPEVVEKLEQRIQASIVEHKERVRHYWAKIDHARTLLGVVSRIQTEVESASIMDWSPAPRMAVRKKKIAKSERQDPSRSNHCHLVRMPLK